MMREVTTAAVLVALIALGWGIASGTQGPPAWFITLPSTEVPYGSLLLIDVYGPPNGTFTVTINAEPFNTSTPVFANTYQEPKGPLLANGTASGEVRINSTYLPINPVQLTVSEAGQYVGSAIVFVSPVVISPFLENQITQLQFDSQENGSRVLALEYEWNRNLEDQIAVVVIAGVLFAVEIFVIVYTRTSARERRLGKKLAEIGHNISHGGQGFVESTGPFKVHREPPVPDLDRMWVAHLCPVCDLPFNRNLLMLHLTGPAHRLKPEEAQRYVKVDPDARKRIQAYLAGKNREAGVSARKAGGGQPGLDWSDIAEGN